jgi:AMOP domain
MRWLLVALSVACCASRSSAEAEASNTERLLLRPSTQAGWLNSGELSWAAAEPIELHWSTTSFADNVVGDGHVDHLSLRIVADLPSGSTEELIVPVNCGSEQCRQLLVIDDTTLISVELIDDSTNDSLSWILIESSSRLDHRVVTQQQRRNLQELAQLTGRCLGMLPPSLCPGANHLPACPPTYSASKADSRYEDDSKCLFPCAANGDCCKSNKGAAGCTRSTQSNLGAGQQCCYDKAGSLITDPFSGAGTLSCFAPASGNPLLNAVAGFLHSNQDVVPYWLCCQVVGKDSGACSDYYRLRPSDNGSGYIAPSSVSDSVANQQAAENTTAPVAVPIVNNTAASSGPSKANGTAVKPIDSVQPSTSPVSSTNKGHDEGNVTTAIVAQSSSSKTKSFLASFCLLAVFAVV